MRTDINMDGAALGGILRSRPLARFADEIPVSRVLETPLDYFDFDLDDDAGAARDLVAGPRVVDAPAFVDAEAA